MTVKISQITTNTDEVILTLTYDNPEGSGNLRTFKLKKNDLYARLHTVEVLLGRALTLQDAKEALVAIVNEVRKGASSIPADFNFAQYINAELEA
jgi:hypothetical protein